MPVNSLFVVKEKYNFLSNIEINVETQSHIKEREEIIAITIKDRLYNEIIIKEMIVALEDTVKILEKKVYDLKKNKTKKNMLDNVI